MTNGIEAAKSAGEERARRLMDRAQAAASRAGDYVQASVSRVAERAQELARDASDRMTRMTGRPLPAWTAEARDLVRQHPLRALAITMGVGYLLGKLMKRG